MKTFRMLLVLFCVLVLTGVAQGQKMLELDERTSVTSSGTTFCEESEDTATRYCTWGNIFTSMLSFGGSFTGTCATVAVDSTSATTTYIGLFTSATGNLAIKTDSELTYNATTGALTSTLFVGNLSGNAATATALASNPTDCSAGQLANSIDASGNLGCTGSPSGLTSLSAGTLTATGASSLTLGTASSATGSIILKNSSNAYTFTLLSGTSAASFQWTLPTNYPGGNNYLLKVNTDGTMDYTDPAGFQTADSDLSVWATWTPPSTGSSAANDVWYVSAAGTVSRVAASADSLAGWGGDGTFGAQAKHTHVWTAAPSSDHTYSGVVTTGIAGETLNYGDVVYAKNSSGTEKFYKFDANGTDKALPPRYVVVSTSEVTSGNSATLLIEGIVRHDAWSMTTNQDEGKLVYADVTTAGGITLTRPSTAGDMVYIIGVVREENVIHFKFNLIGIEVPAS